jgi:hypothetical protein
LKNNTLVTLGVRQKLETLKVQSFEVWTFGLWQIKFVAKIWNVFTFRRINPIYLVFG